MSQMLNPLIKLSNTIFVDVQVAGKIEETFDEDSRKLKIAHQNSAILFS